jgi:hypothetical protein
MLSVLFLRVNDLNFINKKVVIVCLSQSCAVFAVAAIRLAVEVAHRVSTIRNSSLKTRAVFSSTPGRGAAAQAFSNHFVAFRCTMPLYVGSSGSRQITVRGW